MSKQYKDKYAEVTDLIDNLRPSTLLKWLANRDNGYMQEQINWEIADIHQTLADRANQIVVDKSMKGLKDLIEELKHADNNNPSY